MGQHRLVFPFKFQKFIKGIFLFTRFFAAVWAVFSTLTHVFLFCCPVFGINTFFFVEKLRENDKTNVRIKRYFQRFRRSMVHTKQRVVQLAERIQVAFATCVCAAVVVRLFHVMTHLLWRWGTVKKTFHFLILFQNALFPSVSALYMQFFEILYLWLYALLYFYLPSKSFVFLSSNFSLKLNCDHANLLFSTKLFLAT